VPIHFSLRIKGESKLSLKQQFRYLEHLSRLYDFTFPRLSPVTKFLIALMVSWLAAAMAYTAMLLANVGPATATTLAYGIALAATAVFHMRYVRTQREFLVRRTPWRDFAVIASVEWIACGLTAAWLKHRLMAPVSPVEMFLIPFGLATVVRYVLRKELMEDIRGLRRELRREEMMGA
jgi:dolichol-phosphate mannosyltransferase